MRLASVMRYFDLHFHNEILFCSRKHQVKVLERMWMVRVHIHSPTGTDSDLCVCVRRGSPNSQIKKVTVRVLASKCFRIVWITKRRRLVLFDVFFFFFFNNQLFYYSKQELYNSYRSFYESNCSFYDWMLDEYTRIELATVAVLNKFY